MINNNSIKSKILAAVCEIANLHSYTELSSEQSELPTCNFEIVIITNNNIKHSFVFDYHGKLLNLEHDGDLSKMTDYTFITISAILASAKNISAK